MSQEFDYISVPFKPLKKVPVVYRHVGILKPAPYDLEGIMMFVDLLVTDGGW